MREPFITVDETNPQNPRACLHVAGHEFLLSAPGLEALGIEIKWARERIGVVTAANQAKFKQSLYSSLGA